MDPVPVVSAAWWIATVELPALGGLFWLLMKLRREIADRMERGEARDAELLGRTRDELAAFKLEVARGYVPLSVFRDLDRRISDHLDRIEEKLDQARLSVARAEGGGP
ncbi:MAG: hypothetical protein IT557_09970 [Alphaproteobacteria bacterium]|nr:hypothetical protein [Alphaproteobacteria bacterium]